MPLSFGFSKSSVSNALSPMILEIDTSLSAGLTYTLVLGSTNATCNVLVDWGDGSQQWINTSNAGFVSIAAGVQGGASGYVSSTDHTYGASGVYQIKIYGTVEQIGWGFNGNTYTNFKKLKRVLSWGNILTLKSLSIGNQSSLTEVPSKLPKTVTGLPYMFYNCTTFNQNISGWDVSNVTSMSQTFRGATSFNQNIGSWDVSKVSIMSNMFNQATAFNQNIGGWNTSSVTQTNNMFNGATAFNQDLGSWNVSNVTNFNYMFQNATAFTNGGTNNIGNWSINTSSAVTMTGMFYLASAFNANIGAWNTSRVTSMQGMFSTNTAFNQNIGSWDTSNVTTMYQMFLGATAFNQNLGSWNVSNVTDFRSMFNGAIVFNNGGSNTINNWSLTTDASKSILVASMFQNAKAFNQPLGSWNTSRITNMDTMFYRSTFDTPMSFNQNIGSWNTSNVTSMIGVFQNNTAFNQNISSWDVSKVTNMTTMFSGASAFNQNIGGWSLNNTVTMTNMLSNSGLSNENYSRTLIGWANYVSSTGTAKSRSLGATGRKYNSTNYGGSPYNTGSGARTYLTTALASSGGGWTISDGGAGA